MTSRSIQKVNTFSLMVTIMALIHVESHAHSEAPPQPPLSPVMEKWLLETENVCHWVTSLQFRADRRLYLAFNHLTNSHSVHSTNTSGPLYVFQECDEFACRRPDRWLMERCQFVWYQTCVGLPAFFKIYIKKPHSYFKKEEQTTRGIEGLVVNISPAQPADHNTNLATEAYCLFKS